MRWISEERAQCVNIESDMSTFLPVFNRVGLPQDFINDLPDCLVSPVGVKKKNCRRYNSTLHMAMAILLLFPTHFCSWSTRWCYFSWKSYHRIYWLFHR